MRSVGMRKRNWFKTAGVLTFGAQLLAGAGVAHATDRACFPMPTFVSGGDPAFDKLDTDNVTRWTGSSGYGWNSGGLSELSYQGAIGSNPEYPVSGHPEIGQKRLLLSFSRQVPVPQVDGLEGMRIGFNYAYTDPHSGSIVNVSEIIALNFDIGGHVSTWNSMPPACSAATPGVVCANDPATDPATFVGQSPTLVTLLQKLDDGTPAKWPIDSSGADPTAWVKSHTKFWIFSDSSSGTTKYYWKMQMALPLRGGVAPDPTANWTSPSIFLADTAFSAVTASKTVPPFWLDMLTQAADATGIVYKHFPDWADDSAVGRDATYQIPSTTSWAQAEIGSPRDPALITPGDIQCSGTGLLIEGTVGDNVVYHSNIWNQKAGTNTAGLFNDGGRLYMLDASNIPAHNNMVVQVKNTSSNAVAPTTINAQFLIAPYGSQAVSTIWSPLNTGGNDYTCGASGTHQASCKPAPKSSPTINSVPVSGTGSSVTQGNSFELNQSSDWIPAYDYLCAVQTSDTAPYSWYYQAPALAGSCASAVYAPSDTTGGNQLMAGLPGHQCIQVQLSATTAGVQFATKSAFRNMYQATASLRRETATIDTRGLKKITGQTYHNIYLYVETHNMPYRVDAGYSPPTYNTVMQVYNRYNGGKGNDGPPATGFQPGVPAPSESYFSKTMPTFVVHAYADTGATYTVNGRTVPVLTPLTSFGQFVSHDATTEGPAYGWDASLEPFAGTGFQKVGVDTYRLQIPNDAAGQVVTHVEALPTKRPTCSGKVNMSIIDLLRAILPLITVSPADAAEINALIDSLQIQCVDLNYALSKISGENWGGWTSWVKTLVTEVELASGCTCK
jgi:hypothetical protein